MIPQETRPIRPSEPGTVLRIMKVTPQVFSVVRREGLSDLRRSPTALLRLAQV